MNCIKELNLQSIKRTVKVFLNNTESFRSHSDYLLNTSRVRRWSNCQETVIVLIIAQCLLKHVLRLWYAWRHPDTYFLQLTPETQIAASACVRALRTLMILQSEMLPSEALLYCLEPIYCLVMRSMPLPRLIDKFELKVQIPQLISDLCSW